MDTVLHWIGQGMGLIAIFLGFVSYQMKNQRQLILAQSATALCFCIHYLLLGAITGLALNGVALVRNGAYYFRNQKGQKGWALPIAFAVVMGGMGVWAWEGWYSLFSIVGLVINTLCLAAPHPQQVRKSILVTSPLVIIYNVFVFSIGGVIYESVAIISSIVGIWRSRQQPAVHQS